MELRSHPQLREGGKCIYLPERDCRFLVLSVRVPVGSVLGWDMDPSRVLPPGDVEEMLARGFFRTGYEFWIHSCRTCQECIPMRLPVRRFCPSRSQRRTWRRNQDLSVETGPPEFNQEKYALICRHRAKFSLTRPCSEESFRRMWLGLGRGALEFCYYREKRLVGLGLVDPTPNAAASLEFWHEVDARRNLGTFSLLYEIEWARSTGREHLYLGPYVRDAPSMAYKAAFRPFELLVPGNGWNWIEGAAPGPQP